MKIIILHFMLLGLLFFESCSNPTGEINTPTSGYKEILSVNMSDVNVKMFVYGYDSLTTGYNDIYFKVNKNNSEQKTGSVKFMPVMWMSPEQWHSTPVSSSFIYDDAVGYFRGYAVFLMATSSVNIWQSVITYQDGIGTNYVSDSTPTYTSYHEEKQWRLFYDSTEHVSYFLSLVKPFSPVKGLNDFAVVLHQSDIPAQYFQLIDQATMYISVYETDSLNHSASNISPTIGSDGIYKGKINLPYGGKWNVCDTIFYHSHYITNNPTHVPEFNYDIH